MNIDINKLDIPGLVHIQMDSQYEISSTFMRLQEFYESKYKNIRGRYFTIEQYMDTYAKDTGNFTYTLDWNGFNVPGNVFLKFVEIFNDSLLRKEDTLLDYVYSTVCEYTRELYESGKFYVIGTHKECNEALAHEICHALFYLDKEYQKEAKKLVSNFPLKEKFKKRLEEMGYTGKVVIDETNAYMATSTLAQLKSIGFPEVVSKEVLKPFKDLFLSTITKYTK